MRKYNIAIVKASWHRDIVNQLAESCTETLSESLQCFELDTFEVPGVVEIPLFTKKLLARQNYDAIVVCGLIADHGVYRHDFVARTVMDAVMALQMESGVPVIYGILTPQDFTSEGRESFFFEHFGRKGIEAAEALLMTLENDRRLSEMSRAAM